jgi:hypothetical protein
VYRASRQPVYLTRISQSVSLWAFPVPLSLELSVPSESDRASRESILMSWRRGATISRLRSETGADITVGKDDDLITLVGGKLQRSNFITAA